MAKKIKVQLAETQQEVERLNTLHADLTAQHASLQAKHQVVESSANSFKQDAEKHKEESATLKLSLAQQENKFQDLQTSHAADLKRLKIELEEAQLAAQEAAEAAEAAAATATAAAAAAAAMAGGDSDDEYMMDDDKMGDAMANAEASREVRQAENEGQAEILKAMRKQLEEETSKRKATEMKLRRLEDQQGLTSMSSQLRSAEEAAHKSSSDLVAQGEKNLKLHDKFSKMKSKLTAAEESVAIVRRALVTEIAGQNAEFALYEHVSFADLARLALQGKRNGVGGGSAEEKDGSSTTSTSLTMSAGGGGGGQQLESIRRAESELKALRTALKQSQHECEKQRALATKGRIAETSLGQLKEKNMELANRVAREKDRFVGQKDEVRRRDDRLQALSDHIEKLMIHLKHEAAAKAKAVDQQKRAGREVRINFVVVVVVVVALMQSPDKFCFLLFLIFFFLIFFFIIFFRRNF